MITAGVLCLLATALVARLIQVRRVRYNRVNALLHEYAHLAGDLDKMTYQEAEKILLVSQLYDLPLIVTLSLSFALFKTYAVPTISAVLCKSKQLSGLENVGRRAEDTAIVIGEFVHSGGLDTERSATALARMNYLHSRYGNLITRDDKLYTLSAFVFEPETFAARYEWRPLTPLEAQARYVFWREVGARMDITNIPPTKQALWDWKEAYEKEHFKFAATNKEVGDATMQLFVRPFPEWLKPWGIAASTVFLDDRTREAFGLPRSPAWMYVVVPGIVYAKGYICKYLLLPRSKPPHYNETTAVTDDKGNTRYVRQGFLFEPWYVAEDATPMGVFAWVRPGGKWQSQGFTPSTLGPPRLRGAGQDEVRKNAQAMMEQGARGCPFFV